MGYVDITIGGSDGAADTYAEIQDVTKKAALRVIKILTRELRAQHTMYNTTGPTNVALVLTEGHLRDLFLFPESRELVEKTIEAMKEQIAMSIDPEEWDGDIGNRDMHLTRWRELLRKLRRRLKSLPQTEEEWERLYRY